MIEGTTGSNEGPGAVGVVEERDWRVYLLRCNDGSLYTGVAADLVRRLREHNGELAGGARYTRGRRPVELVWQEICGSRSEAQQREAQIKSMSRPAKLRLIGQWKQREAH